MIDVTQRRAADAWFLDRGLPAVLRPGALVRRLWPRSAPALAGVRRLHGQLRARRRRHRQAHHRHRRPTDPDGMVRPGAARPRAAHRGVGRLAGLAHLHGARPQRRGDRRGGHRDRRRHPRRPQPAGAGGPHLRGHRVRRHPGADRVRRRLDPRLGRADDDVEPCRGGIVGDPRPAAAIADVPGLLQLPGVADGGHDLASALVAGAVVPRRDRGGVRGVRHRRPGHADHGGRRPGRRPLSATGRHTVRDDAGSRERPSAEPHRAAQRPVRGRRIATQPDPDHRGDGRPCSS